MLVQPGTNQLLLAVTEDDCALYQEGETVYATKLERNAERTVVAQVPAGNTAFPLQVGREVFVWTAPQPQVPGLGVSPLVLWTSDRGPQLISAQSAVGLIATAASDDDRQIVFTTNASDDSLRGDLAYARTSDAQSPTILLVDIPLGFPSGPCRPLAGFGGSGSSQFPVAEYCPGSDTTATLSTWEHGKKTDLISNIQTPLLFTLEADPQGTTFLVNLADKRVATVTSKGKVSIVDDVAGAKEFVNRRGTVVYSTPTSAGLELRIARHGRSPEVVSPLAALYANRYNRNGYFKSRTSSADGSLALYASAFDPSTFLTDMNLLDVDSGASRALESGLIAAPGSEIFTSDSRYAMYLVLLDPVVGIGTLFAGNRRGAHQIGTSETVWDVLRADDSNVTYNDNPVFDPNQFLFSTADLWVADASDPDTQPRLISAQANLFYLPSEDRRRVIFYSQAEAGGPGLYVASARR